MLDTEILPKPRVKRRSTEPHVLQTMLEAGLPPVIANIIAARPVATTTGADAVLQLRLQNLSQPSDMKDISLAAKRLALAITTGECIGLETDHDCDGQTAHAVIYETLVINFIHPPEKIRSYIGHRLQEGYGLSEAVKERILADNPRPSLIITADNGSADEPRIKALKQNGIDVIVTDHHEIPKEGIPVSAYACLNPTRKDCSYPDKYIAGCMVAWLLMCETRKELIKVGYLPTDAPKLASTLDFVAVGTVADCVSLAKSNNNRVVINYGLKLLSQKLRPCWQVLSLKAPITAEDIAYTIAPLLNSDGRLSSALRSLSFLLSNDYAEASEWLDLLTEQNKERKKIQQYVTSQGFKKASELAAAGNLSLAIFLADGHPGVHGISASKVKDAYGRPTAFIAPKVTNKELATGSMRGIDNFDVKAALDYIVQCDSELLISYGGHKGAGGFTFKLENLDKFSHLFELAVGEQLKAKDIGPIILTDGLLDSATQIEHSLSYLKQLEPFGREFEVPIFEIPVLVNSFKLLGDKTHAKLQVILKNTEYSALWFSFKRHIDNLDSILKKKVILLCSLRFSKFQDNKIEFHIINII